MYYATGAEISAWGFAEHVPSKYDDERSDGWVN
jgi:hypothetical protein